MPDSQTQSPDEVQITEVRVTPVEPQVLDVQVDETETAVVFYFDPTAHFSSRIDLFQTLRDALRSYYSRFVLVMFASQVHETDQQILSCPATGTIYYDPLAPLRDIVTVANEAHVVSLAKVPFNHSYTRKKRANAVRRSRQPVNKGQTA